MTHNKEYELEKDTVFELLNAIDIFQTNMESFMRQNREYAYTIDLHTTNKKWYALIKVTKKDEYEIKTT